MTERYRPCAAEVEPGAGPAISGTADDDFAPLADPASVPRVTATAVASAADAAPPSGTASGRRESTLVGILVHRLFQWSGGRDFADAERVRFMARSLLRDLARSPDPPHVERAGPMPDGADPEAILTRAIEAFTLLRQQPDVAAALADAECLFEVPVSLRLDSTTISVLETEGFVIAGDRPPVVRGAIDCLAVRPDGSIVVIDFKTGAPKAADRAQVAIYVAAARALFPGRPVSGLIAYPQRAGGG
jgi:ATP-dependent exoDNAse (exonuclease V) beta subunit